MAGYGIYKAASSIYWLLVGNLLNMNYGMYLISCCSPDVPVLRDLNMDIQAGQKLILCGRTGRLVRCPDPLGGCINQIGHS